MNERIIIQQNGINVYVEENNGIINLHSKRIIPQFLTSIPKVNLNKIVGRDSDVKKINSILEVDDKVLIINGLGGIGKTTLAKKILELDKDSYNHVVYIENVNSFKESIISNYSLIANLDLNFKESDSSEKKYELILNELNKLKGNNLFIIDNVNEDIISELDKLPSKESWKIIATSRLKLDRFISYELDVLPFDEAKKIFLLHFTGNYDENELEYLFNLIGRHTLTIELIAKTLETNFIFDSIKGFTNYIENNKLDDKILQTIIRISHSKEEVTIYTHLINTFLISDLGEYEKWILLQISILPSLDILKKKQ